MVLNTKNNLSGVLVMLEVLQQILIFGMVLGGIYALASLGMGLAWGLMHVVNFAHGEWIMISMYTTYWLSVLLHLDPYLLIPINIGVGMTIGAASQKFVFAPVSKRGGGALMTILSTFGISMLMTGIAQALWTQTIYTLPNSYINTSLRIGSISISAAHLNGLVISLVTILAIYLILKKTLTGKAILGTSEITGDTEAASLMGVDTDKIKILSLGLAGAATGVAGTVIATFYYVSPTVGITWGLLGFVVVTLGGLGSFSGLLISGILVGALEAVGDLFLGQAYGYILVYAVFILVLYVRPKGLKGRV
jgi:branched-chain amino acid transport system permease protein